MSAHKREKYISQKFDEQFNLSIKQIGTLRVEGKIAMYKEGAYYRALHSLIRCYCAFERLSFDNCRDNETMRCQKLLAN